MNTAKLPFLVVTALLMVSLGWAARPAQAEDAEELEAVDAPSANLPDAERA